MATYNSNSGVHQLPSNCYPPSESDDEDSFVVLNNSLGPDVHVDRAHLNTEPISTQTIQASLDSIADILAQQIASASQNGGTAKQLVVDTSHSNFQSTEISPDEIQKKVDNLISENLKLKETLAQNNIAMKKQVETITQWQEEVQRVQESHKEKFADMKKYIAILKTENDQLKDAVKNLENRSAEEETKKTREILVKQTENLKQFELEAALKKIKELEKALDILSLERESLGKELSAKDQELHNTVADKDLLKYELDLSKQKEMKQTAVANEIQTLKDEIVELRDTNNNLADLNSSLKSNNEKLKANIAEREETLISDKISYGNLERELAQTKQQLMASQMHITELKESHVKVLSEKDKEIEAWRNKVKDCEINIDENAALRAQLDLYKNDFEMERTQRKEIFTEKNKIADDLQQLQRRNNQLLEEIDQLRSGFVPVKREEVRTAPPPESPPRQRLICPICSAKFGSVLLLDDHIDYCLANANS